MIRPQMIPSEPYKRPVLDIAECAISTAPARDGQFGIISILQNSIDRHAPHMRKRLLHQQCAGDRPLGLSVAEVEGGAVSFVCMADVGRTLRDDDVADVLIMGCTGMERHRASREKELGIPVIDPTQAAASIGICTLAMAGS